MRTFTHFFLFFLSFFFLFGPFHSQQANTRMEEHAWVIKKWVLPLISIILYVINR